jgi:hypothetical protein
VSVRNVCAGKRGMHVQRREGVGVYVCVCRGGGGVHKAGSIRTPLPLGFR